MADIQPGGRLIEQHNRRLLGQHHGDPRPLALAAGEGIDALPREVGNAGGLHRPADRLFILFAPAGKQRLVRIAPAGHQLLNRYIPRRGGVLRQQADALCHLFTGVTLDLLAVEINMTAGGRHQAAQGAQQRRFTAAVGANNGGKVAVGNGDVQRFGDGFFAVRQGQLVAAQTGGDSGHFLRDS